MSDSVGVATKTDLPTAETAGATPLAGVTSQPWLVPVVLLVAVTVAHSELLVRLSRRLWAVEHYQFFPLVWGLVAWLVWKRTRSFWGDVAIRSPVRRAWRGGLATLLSVAGALVGCALLAAAVLLDSPLLGGVSFLVWLLWLAHGVGGTRLTRRVWVPWFLLWFSIPLPLGIDEWLVQSMQRLASVWAGRMLDLLAVQHVVSGVVIQLPERAYLVEEACSGIHSLFAALFCVAFYLVWKRQPLWRGLVLLVMAVVWVLVVNVTRVVTITLADYRAGIPVADGWAHDAMGIVFFVLLLGLIASTHSLVYFVVPKRKPGVRGKKARRRRRKRAKDAIVSSPTAGGGTPAAATAGNNWLWLTAAGGLVVVGAAQWAMALARPARPERTPFGPLTVDNANRLPGRVGNWERVGFEVVRRKPHDPNGGTSVVWTYQSGGHRVVFSIDGPFIGWHNMASCLAGQGWRIVESENIPFAASQRSIRGGYTQVRVDKGTGRHAVALFATFDERGRGYPPPETYGAFRLIRRFPRWSGYLQWFGGGVDDPLPESRTYQMHLFVEDVVPLESSVTDDAAQLYYELVEHVVGFSSSTESRLNDE